MGLTPKLCVSTMAIELYLQSKLGAAIKIELCYQAFKITTLLFKF